jgi:hypothetical protein
MENFSIDPYENLSYGHFQEVMDMRWKKAKKRGMMAIPLEIDRYFKMSFTFMPVMRSVKGESLDEP